MPAFLGELAVGHRADTSAFLQRHNLAYAVGFGVLKILSWYPPIRVILSRLQQTVGAREAADMFCSERRAFVVWVHGRFLQHL
jgi:hypothetical protein